MPGDSEHPVTVGDLQVRIPQGDDATGWWDYRPATVADLVLALRAEGVLVIEKVDGEWPDWALTPLRGAFLGVPILDALAEAQPFPPAGGVS